MEITEKLKERFCKDCNIPIKIFQEPYFKRRLELWDNHSLLSSTQYEIFVEELNKYDSEQTYFEDYNRVKDNAIKDIKNSAGYQRFNEVDMNKFTVKKEFQKLPCKDIYQPSNDKRVFLSIDMEKANFNALRQYDQGIFNEHDSWPCFIKQYTDNTHICTSKYIRQVILGNCNCKRHITYEKYLMSLVLEAILELETFCIEDVVFFSNDEIVFDITDKGDLDCIKWDLKNKDLYQVLTRFPFPLRVEEFKLHKISGCKGYIKMSLWSSVVDIKCVDNEMMPFVLCYLYNIDPIAADGTFIHNGRLCTFNDIPQISIDFS